MLKRFKPLVALAALVCAASWAQPASAQSASIAPVSFSAEFQEELDDELGVREAETLAAMLERALAGALERRDISVSADAPVRIEAEILDAAPNRPTFEQLSRNPSISYTDSISTGGASLRATITGPGETQREVSYRYFTPHLGAIIGLPTQWSDAGRAMQRFARRVAEAVDEPAP